MFFQRSSRGDESVPRRRHSVTDDPSRPVSSHQFRRNQTLSSYRHNTPDESARQKTHQLTSQRRRIGGVFLIVTIAAVALVLLLWQLVAQVHVTTSTQQLSVAFSGTAYEKSVNDYLSINPAQRLRFALNKAALSAYVASEYPEVVAVELSGTPHIAQATISITFRTPVAGWQINNKQYYVDASGVVFEKNYYDAPGVQIIDESGVSPDQGGAVVGTRLLGFLGRVVAQAQGRGYSVTKAVIPAETARQIDVYIGTSTTRIKFSIDRGAGEQVEDADRSLKYLQSRGTVAEYIDVRVAGRAAYR